MPVYRTQAIIATADNVPDNYATNTWHCLAPDLAEVALWHTALQQFYLDTDVRLSNLARGTNGLELVSYDLDDPTPRAPVLRTVHNLTIGGGNPLPPECTLVISFQAEQSSGIPQARRRNRIYWPFPGATSNGTDGRPSPAFITVLRDAADALLTASGPTSSDWQWIVYSPTDATFDLVDNGWIDNEWDTQRRRGRESTTRDLF